MALETFAVQLEAQLQEFLAGITQARKSLNALNEVAVTAAADISNSLNSIQIEESLPVEPIREFGTALKDTSKDAEEAAESFDTIDQAVKSTVESTKGLDSSSSTIDFFGSTLRVFTKTIIGVGAAAALLKGARVFLDDFVKSVETGNVDAFVKFNTNIDRSIRGFGKFVRNLRVLPEPVRAFARSLEDSAIGLNRSVKALGALGVTQDSFVSGSKRFINTFDAIEDSLVRTVSPFIDLNKQLIIVEGFARSVGRTLDSLFLPATKAASAAISTFDGILARLLGTSVNSEGIIGDLGIVIKNLSTVLKTGSGSLRVFADGLESANLPVGGLNVNLTKLIPQLKSVQTTLFGTVGFLNDFARGLSGTATGLSRVQTGITGVLTPLKGLTSGVIQAASGLLSVTDNVATSVIPFKNLALGIIRVENNLKALDLALLSSRGALVQLISGVNRTVKGVESLQTTFNSSLPAVRSFTDELLTRFDPTLQSIRTTLTAISIPFRNFFNGLEDLFPILKSVRTSLFGVSGLFGTLVTELGEAAPSLNSLQSAFSNLLNPVQGFTKELFDIAPTLRDVQSTIRTSRVAFTDFFDTVRDGESVVLSDYNKRIARTTSETARFLTGVEFLPRSVRSAAASVVELSDRVDNAAFAFTTTTDGIEEFDAFSKRLDSSLLALEKSITKILDPLDNFISSTGVLNVAGGETVPLLTRISTAFDDILGPLAFFTDGLRATIPQLIDFSSTLRRFTVPFKTFIDDLVTAAPFLGRFRDAIADLGVPFTNFSVQLVNVSPLVKSFSKSLVDISLPLSGLADGLLSTTSGLTSIRTALRNVIVPVGEVIIGLKGIVTGLSGVNSNLLTTIGPVRTLATGFTSLTKNLGLLESRLFTVEGTLNTISLGLGKAVLGFNQIKDVIVNLSPPVVLLFQNIQTKLSSAFDVLKVNVIAARGSITDFRKSLEKAFPFIKDIRLALSALLKIVKDFFSSLSKNVPIFKTVSSGFKTAKTSVTEFSSELKTLTPTVSGTQRLLDQLSVRLVNFGASFRGIVPEVAAVTKGLRSGVTPLSAFATELNSATPGIRQFGSELNSSVSSIQNFVGEAFSGVSGAETLEDAFESLASPVNKANAAFDSATETVRKVTDEFVAAGPKSRSLGNIFLDVLRPGVERVREGFIGLFKPVRDFGEETATTIKNVKTVVGRFADLNDATGSVTSVFSRLVKGLKGFSAETVTAEKGANLFKRGIDALDAVITKNIGSTQTLKNLFTSLAEPITKINTGVASLVPGLGPVAETLEEVAFAGTAASVALSGVSPAASGAAATLSGAFLAAIIAINLALAGLASILGKISRFFLSLALDSATAAADLELLQLQLKFTFQAAEELGGVELGSLDNFKTAISGIADELNVTDASVTKTANSLLQLQRNTNFSREDLLKLIKVTGALGVKFGDQDRANLAVIDSFKGLPLPIQNLIGVNVKAESVSEQLRNELASGVDILEKYGTENEELAKKQIIFNRVLEGAQPIVDALGTGQSNLNLSTAKLNASISELNTTFGKFAGPIITKAVDLLTIIVDLFNKLPAGVIGAVAVFTTLVGIIGTATAAFLSFGAAIVLLQQGNNILNKILSGQIKLFEQVPVELSKGASALAKTNIQIRSTSDLFRSFGSIAIVQFEEIQNAIGRYLISLFKADIGQKLLNSTIGLLGGIINTVIKDLKIIGQTLFDVAIRTKTWTEGLKALGNTSIGTATKVGIGLDKFNLFAIALTLLIGVFSKLEGEYNVLGSVSEALTGETGKVNAVMRVLGNTAEFLLKAFNLLTDTGLLLFQGALFAIALPLSGLFTAITKILKLIDRFTFGFFGLSEEIADAAENAERFAFAAAKFGVGIESTIPKIEKGAKGLFTFGETSDKVSDSLGEVVKKFNPLTKATEAFSKTAVEAFGIIRQAVRKEGDEVIAINNEIVDKAIENIDERVKNEKNAIQAITNLEIDRANDTIALEEKTADKLLKILKNEEKQRIETSKNVQVQITDASNERKRLASKERAAVIKEEIKIKDNAIKAIKDTIKALKQFQKDRIADAKAAAETLKDIEKTVADEIFDIEKSLLTDAESNAFLLTEIRKKQREAEKAIQEGRFSDVEEINNRIIELQGELTETGNESAREVANTRTEILKEVERTAQISQGNIIDANQTAAAEVEKAIELAKEKVTELESEVRASVRRLAKETVNIPIGAKVDDDLVRQEIARFEREFPAGKGIELPAEIEINGVKFGTEGGSPTPVGPAAKEKLVKVLTPDTGVPVVLSINPEGAFNEVVQIQQKLSDLIGKQLSLDIALAIKKGLDDGIDTLTSTRIDPITVPAVLPSVDVPGASPVPTEDVGSKLSGVIQEGIQPIDIFAKIDTSQVKEANGEFRNLEEIAASSAKRIREIGDSAHVASGEIQGNFQLARDVVNGFKDAAEITESELFELRDAFTTFQQLDRLIPGGGGNRSFVVALNNKINEISAALDGAEDRFNRFKVTTIDEILGLKVKIPVSVVDSETDAPVRQVKDLKAFQDFQKNKFGVELELEANTVDIEGGSIHPLSEAANVIADIVTPDKLPTDLVVMTKKAMDAFDKFAKDAETVTTTVKAVIPSSQLNGIVNTLRRTFKRNTFDVKLKADKIDIKGGSVHPLDEVGPVLSKLFTPDPLGLQAALKDAVLPVIPAPAPVGALAAGGVGGGPTQTVRVELGVNGQVFPVDTTSRESADNLIKFSKELKLMQRTRGESVSPFDRGSSF